jgi:hypothetical protein
MQKTLVTVLVVLLVLVSGCSDGGGGGADPTDTDAGDSDGLPLGDGDGTSGDGGDGGDGAAGECGSGQSMSFADPQSGQQVSLDVEGQVTHDGRQVCKAVWETSGDDTTFSRMEMFYDPDGEYQVVRYYDNEGNLLFETNVTGGAGAGQDGPMGDGMAGTDMPVGSGDWCAEGQTTAFSNPQTGEVTRLEIRGVQEHNDRQTCFAVWETDGGDGEIQRMEMYYTQEGGYTHVIYYDGEGNVVNEIEVSEDMGMGRTTVAP